MFRKLEYYERGVETVYSTEAMKKILKRAVIIVIVIFVGKEIMDFVNPKVTDVTPYLNMTKPEIEETLDISFSSSPDMVKKIYGYTNGKITVDGNSDNSIGIVYIDGKQVGFHLDNRRYGMYGIEIGDSFLNVEDKITYEYERQYEVLTDIGQGASSATFYRNYSKGDCLVVVVNDTSGRVVALTYFSDGKKAMERLAPLR